MADRCIPVNPDISGTGVRAAIYAQNLLCFAPVVAQSIGMLAIAFAILISTVIQTTAKTSRRGQSITNFHAAIILDLSWMNNTSTFIWFLLYAHHQSKNKNKLILIPATWSDWSKLLLSPLRRLGTSNSEASLERAEKGDEREDDNQGRRESRLPEPTTHYRQSSPSRHQIGIQSALPTQPLTLSSNPQHIATQASPSSSVHSSHRPVLPPPTLPGPPSWNPRSTGIGPSSAAPLLGCTPSASSTATSSSKVRPLFFIFIFPFRLHPDYHPHQTSSSLHPPHPTLRPRHRGSSTPTPRSPAPVAAPRLTPPRNSLPLDAHTTATDA